MKTTTILITFLSLFCSSTVTGQVLQRRYENQLEEFNRMKTRGIVMLSVGSVAAVSGTVLIINGTHQLNNFVDDGSSEAYDEETTGSLKIIGGIICGVISIPLTSVGMVFTLFGAHKSKEYKEKIENLSLGIVCTPEVQGLSFVVRF
jgi:hypothetical protein